MYRKALVYHQSLGSLDLKKNVEISCILANYAFQNLREQELEPCIQKLMDALSVGGILLLKEPEPADFFTEEFDSEMQRVIRPKKKYVDLFAKHGGSLEYF
jgi:hypothetical protein